MKKNIFKFFGLVSILLSINFSAIAQFAVSQNSPDNFITLYYEANNPSNIYLHCEGKENLTFNDDGSYAVVGSQVQLVLENDPFNLADIVWNVGFIDDNWGNPSTYMISLDVADGSAHGITESTYTEGTGSYWVYSSSDMNDDGDDNGGNVYTCGCLLYTSPSPRDATLSRMPSSA